MAKNEQTAEDLFSDISDLFVGGSSDPINVDYGDGWNFKVGQDFILYVAELSVT